MKYLSVCSGIEAASVAWKPLGWQAVGFSEIELFPCELLKQRFPLIKNYGDMTKYKEWDVGDFDLLVGGTPCQSYSIAGLRKGINDPRGNLMLVFLGLLDHFKPHYVVWENVPGILSDKTQAFDKLLQGLNELGYIFDTDILDAQYFGVPQRRRRVFVVGIRADWINSLKLRGEKNERYTNDGLFTSQELSSKDDKFIELAKASDKIFPITSAIRVEWQRTRQVQIEQTSVSRNTAESEETKQATSCQIGSNLTTDGKLDYYKELQISCYDEKINYYRAHLQDTRILETKDGTTNAVQARQGTGGLVSQPVLYKTHLQDTRLTECEDGVADTVSARYGTGGNTTPFVKQVLNNPALTPQTSSVVETLRAEFHGHEPVTQEHNVVRRLTPVECERLQGFPDNWTKIKWRGKDDCPDSLRYKAIGNSMAVPVMRFIGERIDMLDKEIKHLIE